MIYHTIRCFTWHNITKKAEVLLYVSKIELNVFLLKINQLSLKIFLNMLR